MSYERAEGFVFKVLDRGEADKHFFIFTKEYGRIEIVGKAIRKISAKLRSGVDLFAFSSLEFVQGKRIKTLTDAVIKKRFPTIARTPEKLTVAYGIASLMGHFIRGEEGDETLWNLLQFTFEKLDASTSIYHQKLCYYYFFWNMIAMLGHGPQIYHCVHCENSLNPSKLFFSYREGGMLCDTHHQDALGSTMTEGAVKILRCILKNDWVILEKLSLHINDKKSFTKITLGYFQYLISMYSFKK